MDIYMAAASSNQPGAQNGPLVFKCVINPQTGELQSQLVGFRPAAVGENGNRIEKWETVIYREYVDLKKKWRDFGLASYMDPKKLEQLKYQWQPVYSKGRLIGYETVWIHTNSELKRHAVSVIILQPSWASGDTLYIVEDSVAFLKLNPSQQQEYIKYVATWWTSADGFARIRRNEAAAKAAIKANVNKAFANANSMFKGPPNNHQPGAPNQGGRRTRRTRRK